VNDWDKLVKERGWEDYEDLPRLDKMGKKERLDYQTKLIDEKFDKLKPIIKDIIYLTLKEKELMLEHTEELLRSTFDKMGIDENGK
tara:strand:- start:42 stop:299 length:258 start_codon:yes stop_codon:yes gene_type:complete